MRSLVSFQLVKFSSGEASHFYGGSDGGRARENILL
jgi:hypothetical protein